MNIIKIIKQPPETISVICPYLDSKELCSIYEDRPSCCRNYPGKGIKFPFTDHIKHTCNEDCINCVYKCCKHINVLKDKISPQDIIERLTMSCNSCGKTFC